MYLKLLRNDLQQRFDVLKYEIIYTPSYFPKFQPIERVWGWSKNFVAQLFYSGRKLEQTYAQMVAVWYGGTSYKAGKPYSRQGETGLSRRLVGNFIRQCQFYMDEWIVAHGLRCSGSIRDQSRVAIHSHTIVLYLIPIMAHYLTSSLEDDSGDEDFDDANEGEDDDE